MKHLLVTSLLALLLSITVSCDKNDEEPKAKPVAPRGIVSGIRLKVENEGEVFEGDFSIEYDENNNITKLGAPANYDDGLVYYYKRQGDKLIVTRTDNDTQELTDEILEATLDDKGRAVTVVYTWTKDFGDEPGVENFVFHYSDNGEIKDHTVSYSDSEDGYESEYTWKDGNIISTKVATSDHDDETYFAKQISSPYENRTNIDFTDIFKTIADYPFGIMYELPNGLLRSSGYLGNMDENLPKEVKWVSDKYSDGFLNLKYRYVLDDNGRPKSIVVVYASDMDDTDEVETFTVTLTISYKN